MFGVEEASWKIACKRGVFENENLRWIRCVCLFTIQKILKNVLYIQFCNFTSSLLKIELEAVFLVLVFTAVAGDLNILVALPVIIFLGCEVAPHHVAENLEGSWVPFLIANVHQFVKLLPVAVIAVQSQVLEIHTLGHHFQELILPHNFPATEANHLHLLARHVLAIQEEVIVAPVLADHLLQFGQFQEQTVLPTGWQLHHLVVQGNPGDFIALGHHNLLEDGLLVRIQLPRVIKSHG